MYVSFLSFIVLAFGIVVAGGFLSALGAHVTGTLAWWSMPDTVTPSAFRKLPNYKDADIGWATYTAAQLGTDLKHQAKLAWTVRREQIARAGKIFNHGAGVVLWFLVFPLPALTFLSFVAAIPFMIALTIIFFVAFAIVYIVGALLHWLLVLAVNIVDGIWIGGHRGRASCPECYRLMTRPAFACSGCNKVHRDIRSGVEGAFYRRCECGQLLPTAVSRATWRLAPVCQHCEATLHKGAGALRDVRVAVLGDTHAGTTRLTLTALGHMARQEKALGRQFTLADEATRKAVEAEMQAARSRTDTVPTQAVSPRAFTARFGGPASGALFHAFDPAGALLQDVHSQDTLTFLAESHGVVFVVDPFSIPSVRQEVQRKGFSYLLTEHPAQGQPEDLYGAVVSRMRASGVKTKKQRLAVVVSKADLLRVAGIEIPSELTEVSRWLEDYGQHNMVIAAQREFGTVRYFASGTVATDGGAIDPSKALWWLYRPRNVSTVSAAPQPEPEKAEAAA